MSKRHALELAAALLLVACSGGGGGKPLIHQDMGTHDMTMGSCMNGQKSCNGVCTDTTKDNNNCGNCGMMCTNGQTCTNSACGGGGCVGNQMMCNGTCTDTSSDNANCGECGVKCTNGQTCTNSACSGGGGTDTCLTIFNCMVNAMCMDQTCYATCEMSPKQASYNTDAVALITCVNTKLGNANDPCSADAVCGANGSQQACGACLYGTCTPMQSCVGGECSNQATPCLIKDM